MMNIARSWLLRYSSRPFSQPSLVAASNRSFGSSAAPPAASSTKCSNPSLLQEPNPDPALAKFDASTQVIMGFSALGLAAIGSFLYYLSHRGKDLRQMNRDIWTKRIDKYESHHGK